MRVRLVNRSRSEIGVLLVIDVYPAGGRKRVSYGSSFVIAVVAELFVVVNTIVPRVILARVFRTGNAVHRQWENPGHGTLIIGIYAMFFLCIYPL